MIIGIGIIALFLFMPIDIFILEPLSEKILNTPTTISLGAFLGLSAALMIILSLWVYNLLVTPYLSSRNRKIYPEEKDVID